MNIPHAVAQPPQIIDKALSVNLDLRVLYEAVIDLSSQGLITANCINMAAGILLNDLGLPTYFFENITKDSLKHLLASITSSIAVQDGRVVLRGRVAHIDFDLSHGSNVQRVRIATQETRDAMEKVIESLISGHRREYYYSRENDYYTYIIRPETVHDYLKTEFSASRFLFHLAGDYTATPEPTRQRYEKFLAAAKAEVTPLIETFNLPATGETRFMFNSDFASPQIPILRQLLKDHGLTLVRAYWEPYWDGTQVPSSICSLYVQGELTRRQETLIIDDIRSFLAFSINPVTQLYVDGVLTFKEMLFAGNAMDFAQMFIFAEDEGAIGQKIMERLGSPAYEEAFAERIYRANRSTFDARTIQSTAMAHPDLLKQLFAMFEQRFDPQNQDAPDDPAVPDAGRFQQILSQKFMDFDQGRQIFEFMAHLVFACLKTNFYKPDKRAFSFRLDSRVLDPLVCARPVFGLFFVNGHYGCGTHMRAGNISRGGLRLLKTTRASHASLVDNAVLLNYATGPRAQHLKHKDICESGASGIVIPHAVYEEYPKDALFDFTEGILDLLQPHRTILDFHGRPEMLFFGPDQGTFGFMEAIALRARERGYAHWRTLTTGKRLGITCNAYGRLDSGKLFGLVPGTEDQLDLWVNGKPMGSVREPADLRKKAGSKVSSCGMAVTGIMAAFRALITHDRHQEKDLNLMITGGPDGRLPPHALLSYKGPVCLAMDTTALVFDPAGLDRDELERIAFKGLLGPGAGAGDFQMEKLSPQGFKVKAGQKRVSLPDGRVVADGAAFLRTFIFDPDNQALIREARIRAFFPFGGFNGMVTQKNVTAFIENFKDLAFIVEGTHLFFNDAARQQIAAQTRIRQIKDSTANKGGVFSSAVAEVLGGILCEEAYEERIINELKNRWALTREILAMIEAHAAQETQILIQQHDTHPDRPLYLLSDRAGEEILAVQKRFAARLPAILKQKSLVWKIMEAYIPRVLIQVMGKKQVMAVLNSDHLAEYRDAMITKKLAALSFYRFSTDWDGFSDRLDHDFPGALEALFAPDPS